jgi:hypothetical protein
MSIDVEQAEQRDVEVKDVAGDERDYFTSYRVLSSSAVASCILGLLGAGNLLAYEYGVILGVIPLVAALLGARALWTIYRNPEEMTGKWLAWSGLVMGVVFLAVGWTSAGYVYATEVPDGYERISYETLQPDPELPGQIMPQTAADLDGRRVYIKGYVYPGAQQRGIKKFVLCRDNGQCCFGGNPKLNDRILVELAEPLRLEYSQRLRRLAGTFHIRPTAAMDGMGGGVLYQLEADYLQ